MSAQPDLDEVLAIALRAAARAGDVIAELHPGGAGTRYKSDRSAVTSADEAADRIIRDEIRARFPDHAVVSEEDDASLALLHSSGPLWVVDPLDGTLNLVHQRGHVAVAIAFALGGVVQVAVVASPLERETFSAIKGRGSFKNGSRIAVSAQRDLRRALIGTGFPHDRSDLDPVMARLRRVISTCQDVRRLGSPALDICWVADGRLDGFYEDLFPWDVAAAGLIAEEAGARRGHLAPVPPGVSPDLHATGVVVAAPAIFDGLAQLVRRI